MKTNLFIISTLFVFIMSCSGIKPKPMKKVLFSDDFRAYTQFEIGSYWIYVDSVSNERDTVTMYSKWKDTITYPNSNVCKIEAASDDIKRSFYKDHGTLGTDLLCESYQAYGLYPAPIFFSNNTQYGVDATFKETVPGDTLGNGNVQGNTIYEQYIDSLNTLGKTYYKIRVFYQDAFSNKTFYPIRGYWARDIGLIRKETSDGRIWLLESYHINR
jgi:hypothetical protein